MSPKAQNHISQRIVRLTIVQKFLKEKKFEVPTYIIINPATAIVLDVAKEHSTLTTAAQIGGILATGGIGVALTTTLPFVGAAAAGGAVTGAAPAEEKTEFTLVLDSTGGATTSGRMLRFGSGRRRVKASSSPQPQATAIMDEPP